jgi:MFS transporter, OFA family, oxalate/formate antiporter
MTKDQASEFKFRWMILLSTFVVMMVISIYQYSWFLFAYTIEKEFAWNPAAIGMTFTVFTFAATFVQPFSGYIADSYGPHKIAFAASFLVGFGFILCSFSSSPISLYFYFGLGALGVGVLYGISIACSVKWFPEKRGFAAGLVVFGFGAGTAVFNFLIQRFLDSQGLSSTFLWVGVFMLIILLPLSTLLTYPDQKRSPSSDSKDERSMDVMDYTPTEMVRTYQWFLIYFSFIATVSIVLMFGAQLKMLAREFDLPEKYFNYLLVLFPMANGISRFFAGIVSDKIGREKTMMLFYSMLGFSIFAFVMLAHIPALFVLLVFTTSLLGGAPFALYPATIGDYYGTTYSTTNYGLTYTAKAWAGLISGWLSGYLLVKFGSYQITMIILAVCSFLAAALSNQRLLKIPSKGKYDGLAKSPKNADMSVRAKRGNLINP